MNRLFMAQNKMVIKTYSLNRYISKTAPCNIAESGSFLLLCWLSSVISPRIMAAVCLHRHNGEHIQPHQQIDDHPFHSFNHFLFLPAPSLGRSQGSLGNATLSFPKAENKRKGLSDTFRRLKCHRLYDYSSHAALRALIARITSGGNFGFLS